jgi:FecR protein
VLLFAMALTLSAKWASAQAAPVEARIASVNGTAVLISVNKVSTDAQRGDALQPGEMIDTRGGGRIAIELNDGSLVVVGPGSCILLKDFRTASTLRELFEILLGRVQVKIDYFGGRPNPYRINTPTASIAVRGTEFRIDVDARGETEVAVLSGLVEVASLANPEDKVFVSPGRGAIVSSNQSIYFYVPSPISEIGGLGGGLNFEGKWRILGADISTDADDQLNVDSPLNSTRFYDRLEENLLSSQESPLFLRFNAYPDSFLDGLQNPAYATEFSVPEGRVLLLPSFSGSQGLRANQTDLLPNSGGSINYSVSPQVSFFTPLPDHRTAIGGSIGEFRSGARPVTLDNSATLSTSLFPPGTIGTRASSVSTTTSFFSSSLVIAHAFGEGRNTSLGLGLDRVEGRESIFSSIGQQNSQGTKTREDTASRSNLHQTRIKVGLSHDFHGGRKLGIYYSYGFLSDAFGNLSRTLNGQPQSLDKTHSGGRTSEVGLRFRGGLTKRLFYGAQASWFSMAVREHLNLSGLVKSHEHDRSTGSSFAIGLGYALKPRIALAFDLASGSYNTTTTRREDGTRKVLETSNRSGPFLSAHGAVQSEISKRLFANVSFLIVHQKLVSDLTLHPDSFGQLLTGDAVYASNGSRREKDINRYSEFGVGWRLTKNLIAEYVFSVNYDDSKSNHLFLLRYNIHLPEH